MNALDPEPIAHYASMNEHKTQFFEFLAEMFKL